MKSLRLEKLDVYRGEGELLITKGDSYLLKISGEDCEKLEFILKTFETSPDIEEVYNKVSSKIDFDKFNNLVNWLVKNHILREEKQEISACEIIHNIALSGDFSDFRQVEELIVKRLETKINKYHLKTLVYGNIELKSLEDIDLLIVFSPIFRNYDEFLKVNEFCYHNNIPTLHLELNMSSFTIGPFSVPEFKTPCLKCYSKRKIVNLEKKEQYLKFIKIRKEKIIACNEILLHNDLGLMLEFVKMELDNFFIRQSMFLYSRSITFDIIGYNFLESKILRIPSCSVCDESSIISPFN